jgi:hypothetical protein
MLDEQGTTVRFSVEKGFSFLTVSRQAVVFHLAPIKCVPGLFPRR